MQSLVLVGSFSQRKLEWEEQTLETYQLFESLYGCSVTYRFLVDCVNLNCGLVLFGLRLSEKVLIMLFWDLSRF